MPVTKGTELWKLRQQHGAEKLFSDANILREEACAYFRWCELHPWYKVELVKYMGEATEAEVPHVRPFSMSGFCVYLGVSGSYFRTVKGRLQSRIADGKATKGEEELLHAIEWIETVVLTQQIEGGEIGMFNANLVSRIHNIADHIRTEDGGSSIKVVVRDQKTADDLSALDDLL